MRFLSVSPRGTGWWRCLYLDTSLTDRECPIEDALLARRAGVAVAEDAEVDLLEHARHGAHEGRLHLGEVVLDLGDRLGEGDRAALGDRRPLEDLGEDVRHRQEQELLVVLVDGQDIAHRVALPDDVLVREHHALGRPGRPRRIDEGEAVVGLDVGPALLELARMGAEPLVTFDAKVAERHQARLVAGDGDVGERELGAPLLVGLLQLGDGIEVDDLEDPGELVALGHAACRVAAGSRRRRPSRPRR